MDVDTYKELSNYQKPASNHMTLGKEKLLFFAQSFT